MSDQPRPGPSPDGLDLEQQVCFALSIAARQVVATYRPLLEPLGLTHPQYLVMLALWQHGAQTVTQLGSLLALDSATVSPLVKRLEALGHVRRTRSGRDERQVVVEPTERGSRLRDEARHVPGAIVHRLDLTLEQISELQSVLERLIDATTAAAARR